jgi:uncharacterized protein (DUF433 family)
MSTPNGKEWKWLERDPKSSMRQLSIKGRRIRALTLYSLTQGEDALTPEEVAATYNLPPESVQEAIEYCRNDPSEIRDDLADEDQLHANCPPEQILRRVS